tara:strand:- start:634 stop:810 length:177 start_codon:yes stop_codon:yes gene_type:complete
VTRLAFEEAINTENIQATMIDCGKWSGQDEMMHYEAAPGKSPLLHSLLIGEEFANLTA